MGKLNRFELSALKYLDDLVKNVGDRIMAMKELTTHMGLTQEEAINIYRLWYFNQKEGVNYSDIDVVENPLIKFVFKMSNLIKSDREKYLNEMYDNHLEELEKIYGYWFHVSCDGWKGKTPSIEWTNYGAEINLDREDWEEENFSGLDGDSTWKYNEAFSNYGGDYEEMDEDELNYMESFVNDETLKHFEAISLLSGRSEWPGKNGKKNINNSEVVDFLSKFLPREYFENVTNEFLESLGVEVGRTRLEDVRNTYNDEIKYKTSNNCTCGDYLSLIHISEPTRPY